MGTIGTTLFVPFFFVCSSVFDIVAINRSSVALSGENRVKYGKDGDLIQCEPGVNEKGRPYHSGSFLLER